MSQHDALLDELGLAPLWVRRDRAATDLASESAPGQATALRDDETGRVASLKSANEEVTSERREVRSPDASAPVRHATADAFESDGPESLEQSEPAGALEQFDAPEASEPIEATEAHVVARVTVPDVSSDAGLPAVSTLDFAALKERVSGCTACGLCEKRTQTVFGVGDEHADWLIVGEAPGENEDKQGEPFVGQAGKLLDNMLRSLGLDRTRNVYIANVIKCRPPGNRDPQPDEVASCEPFLKQQVALIRPKVIVALGRFAAQTLLKSDATISSLRGRVHEYEGVPVIVSYHPAYLLRSLPDKSKAWTDLCLAQATYLKVTA